MHTRSRQHGRIHDIGRNTLANQVGADALCAGFCLGFHSPYIPMLKLDVTLSISPLRAASGGCLSRPGDSD